jgi:hypothetical protein
MWANINHVSFDIANAGKHIYVQMPVGGGPGSFTLGEIDLWNQSYASSTKNELYIQKQNMLADVSVPATASILGMNNTASRTGWTFLPSGILMKWGQATVTVGTSVNVNLNPGGVTVMGPNFVNVYSCQVSFAVTPAPNATLSAIAGNFNITISSNATGNLINWFVIGSGV